MIALIDYGVGNLKSIYNAIKASEHSKNVGLEIVDRPEALKNFAKIILPGVGAFGDAIGFVRERGFDSALQEEVQKGKYVLGICLGMQLLATHSLEHGEHKGLDLIPGTVRPLETTAVKLRIPHIGWNEVKFLNDSPLFRDIPDQSDFYFVHSYYYDCKNPNHALASTPYGIDFTSIVGRDNIAGVQFHPEKSQRAGLKLLENFVRI